MPNIKVEFQYNELFGSDFLFDISRFRCTLFGFRNIGPSQSFVISRFCLEMLISWYAVLSSRVLLGEAFRVRRSIFTTSEIR